MDDERTTQEVMEVLGEDCDRCHAELIAAFNNGEVSEDGSVQTDCEFRARQSFGRIFLYWSGYVFCEGVVCGWLYGRRHRQYAARTLLRKRTPSTNSNDRGEIVRRPLGSR